MRLKSIKLAGFKSFVDPTSVSFPTNLSCVVGPNGCGKSNVIDAVRWVMGESSAKNLRGDAMTDVIFNGSSGRKPVGQASVELIFDNSEGKLIGEYAKYNEISVKRRVTRDAQSTYFLNGTKCRRRDVIDLFLGTGMGARSYAIIEQGMISRLIESKPEELRVFLEEAAGISKYKERRRETENRIRRTQENLERLADIREELGRQLQHLHRQAQAAEKYRAYKTQERQCKAELNALRWRTLNESTQERSAKIRALELELEGIVTGQVSADSQIETLRQQQTESADKFNGIQTEFYEVGAAIARLEQRVQHEQEKAKQLALDLVDIERSLTETQEALTADQLRLEDVEVTLLEQEPEHDLLSAEREESQALLLAAEEKQLEWQDRWDNFSASASKAQRNVEVAKSRIQHLEQSVERLHTRVAKFGRELLHFDQDSDDESLMLLRESVAEAEMGIEAHQARIEAMNLQLDSEQKQTKVISQQLTKKQSEWQEAKGKRASLQALQEAAKADQGVEINQWLAEHNLEHHPRLMQSLEVEPGWEQAIETVLGHQLQSVMLDAQELNSFAPALNQLQSGELMLMIAQRQTPTLMTGSLAEKLKKAPVPVLSYLSKIKAVASLTEANDWLEQSKTAPNSGFESAVTLDGLWIGQGWIKCLKPMDKEQGFLARQQALDLVETQVAELDDEVFELEAVLDTHQLQLTQLEDERQREQKQIHQSLQSLGNKKSELSALEARKQELQKRYQRLVTDQAEAERALEDEKHQLGLARSDWQQNLQLMEKDADQRSLLTQEKEQVRAEVEQAKAKAQQDSERYHQNALKVQSLKQQQQAIKQAIERLTQQSNRLHERQALLSTSQGVEENPIDDLKLQLEEQLAARLVLEERMVKAKTNLDAINYEIRTIEQQRHDNEQRSAGVRTKLEQERMEAQAINLKQNAHQEQIIEAGFEFNQVLESLSADADADQAQSDLESLSQKIQRLGAINLAAIDEYQSQSQRKAYLDQQNDDLESALNTLENAIRKIDDETKHRFQETFDKVSQGFGELFPRVFGGGHAYLALTGDDLLSTGVTIMARPPGKKNSTIHLLSGGEKALTAIALVFSIFRLNPAPFCMLDEVDAPLDDANVGRFANLLKAMSEQVQFIYISHNKIAMEMAHQLMGVTMHEPGVSRLVAVNVEEAVELAES
jgi:chromosome segregation protein